MKCDGTHAETRFRLSTKRANPFKSAGASVQSTTDSRGVRISGSNAGYTIFRGSAKGTGYPLHSPVSTSLPLPCVTVCHLISTGVCCRFTRMTHTENVMGKTYRFKCDVSCSNRKGCLKLILECQVTIRNRSQWPCSMSCSKQVCCKAAPV